MNNPLLMTMEELSKRAEQEEAELAKRVKKTEHGILLDNYYVIEWHRIDTPEKIISWALHLGEKQWVTVCLLTRVIELAHEHHKIKRVFP